MDDLSRPLATPLFLFGTLMDVDVLARVLDRAVGAAELEPAILWGYRRHALIGEPYPVLRPHADCHVQGRLFQPASIDERLRLDHFESGEYEPQAVAVQAGARMVAALFYHDLDGVFEVSEADWSLHHFRTVEKPQYLQACEYWMADYVGID